MEKLLTVKEVAKILRVSEKTIFRYIKAGELKGFKVKKGGHWRVKVSDLNKLTSKN